MKQLPYGVQTKKDIVPRATDWCEQNFGPRWQVAGNFDGTWAVFWLGHRVESNPGGYQWWFETQEQSLLFTLRWS